MFKQLTFVNTLLTDSIRMYNFWNFLHEVLKKDSYTALSGEKRIGRYCDNKSDRENPDYLLFVTV